MTNRYSFVVLVVAMWSWCATASGQWLQFRTPGLPRLGDGKPDLTAPAPQTRDGKPDLTGIWRVRAGFGYGGNIVADLAPGDVLPWAERLTHERLLRLGTDDPSSIGCLPRGPRSITGSSLGQLMKIVQTPTLITILHEDLAYRQIHMDGRPLPKDPQPSFMGYSVGRWEGDTLIVDSIGFNDRTWLDFSGHPHTEALHITERYRRLNVGQVDLQITFDDPGAYRKPWTVPVAVTLAPDTELLEYVCNENEPRAPRANDGTGSQAPVSVPAAVLDEYAGTYAVPAGSALPFRTLRIRRVGNELFLDADERGNILIVPVSLTEFSARVLSLDFRRDGSGRVVEAVNPATGLVLRKQR